MSNLKKIRWIDKLIHKWVSSVAEEADASTSVTMGATFVQPRLILFFNLWVYKIIYVCTQIFLIVTVCWPCMVGSAAWYGKFWLFHLVLPYLSGNHFWVSAGMHPQRNTTHFELLVRVIESCSVSLHIVLYPMWNWKLLTKREKHSDSSLPLASPGCKLFLLSWL